MQATRKAGDVEPKRKKPQRKTAFVPSVVFTTAVAGVVPACVVGCSNGGGGTTPPSVAYCAYAGSNGNCATVAAVGYVAFDAGDGGEGDAPSEAHADVATGDAAGDASDASQDGGFAVADVGFGGG
jgi:hypothetical protein